MNKHEAAENRRCVLLAEQGRWRCVRCGRIFSAPPGSDLDVPPCGWEPEIVEVGGHIWLEAWGGRWICMRCRRQVSDRSALSAPTCPIADYMPPLGVRAWNYMLALRRWLAAGRPRRSASEVEAIMAICRRCPHYAVGRCRLCGCNLRGSSPLTSKVLMATEHCPNGRW